ncbi:LPP20 family lipoprotein [uncultured Phascolarctobacterium sp.]|uniref:LPP20 family lipoprotein n=1 Tax=uncultured Phascolarctobacterium sp. TaxID=512296 RepID=UPI0025F2C5ED|nr:LPP20 family lipoprotein [uncultured Phascolarctobacterium sp.]
MYSKKNLLATVVLGLSMSLTSVAPAIASADDVSVQVNVQQNAKGSVNWEKGAEADVEAWGVGLPPVNMPAERGAALALRAATVDAYRQLAEIIKGVQVDSETTMRDLSVESDVVTAKVEALVQGARVVEKVVNKDGSYSVKVAVPLYGVKSVAAVVIPEANKDLLPQETPEISEDYTPAPEVKAQAASYTGVVVDAAGLGLEGTFSPVIYDVNGRAIYGMRNIDKDFAISKGMVEYYNDLQTATVNSRAGSNPLVVKAVSVRGGGNSVNPVNVVVSVEDGDKILYANEKSGMLENKAVVFVK